MAEEYRIPSEGTEWHKKQRLTKAVSPTSALSGRETPLAAEGHAAPQDHSQDEEEDERALLSLGCELVSFTQTGMVEQHEDRRASDPPLAYLVPGQRQNTPVASTVGPDTFSVPSQNMLRGAKTLDRAMALIAREEQGTHV